MQVAELLRRRVRRAGSEPLVTYYDLGSGERTELSGISFANWVDKTSNLITDEYLLATGDEVELQLADEAPGHWMTFVWAMACWQVGAVVQVADSAREPRLQVIGPSRVAAQASEPAPAMEVLACSLHPLGLGFNTALPVPLVDYAVEVRSQPDTHAAAPVPDTAPAWHDATRTLTQAELIGAAVQAATGSGHGRRLVVASEPWRTVRDGLLAALLSDGSAVVVTGDDDDRLARIRTEERVDGSHG
jgi:uncharacterized protein (TIGR03089 family)